MLRATIVATLTVLSLAVPAAHAATFTVTSDNDADDGTCGVHCSLREAINAANATPLGSDEIVFQGAMTITPLTALPAVATRLTINGTTAANCAGATEQIALDGNAGAFDGLVLAAGSDGSRICRLNIRDFASGIYVTSDDTRIEGCRIGTNPAADAAPDPNTEAGITMKGGDGNTIGGLTETERNVISGNGGYGVVMYAGADGGLVQNNHIGVNLAGTAAIPNDEGVFLDVESESTIGGTAAGAGNLISGNTGFGLWIEAGQAQGNRIGTDAAGVGAIPNQIGGVVVRGTATVGGSTASARNIVSGNDGSQVQVSAVGPVTIRHNWVGPNALGDPLPAIEDGLEVITAPDSLLVADNVVAGHARDGITLSDGVDAVTIERNLVGRLSGGATFAGGDDGIVLGGDTTDAEVAGNTVAGHAGNGIETEASGAVIEDNTVTGNGGDGVSVGSFATGTSLFVNRIHDNGGLGIDLLDDGVTANDAGDGDVELTNFPVLTSAVADGAATTVTGTLDTIAGRTYAVEVFSSTTCDGSGNGEGETVIGAVAVTAGSGPTGFSVTGIGTAAGRQITATATDLTTLDTSEFSACLPATAPVATTTGGGGLAPAPPPPVVAVVAPPAAPRFPAKIRVLRNGVDDGVLDMLIEITARAVTPGAVLALDYESSGRHTTFTVPITGTQIKVRKRLPSTQPKDTGITTVAYAGNAVVDPDDVRLRAADGKSLLVRSSSAVIAGRVTAAGTVVSTARGVVRIRFSYARPDGTTGFLNWNATISSGKWSLAETLPAGVAAGQLSIQFTGYDARGLRGEQTAKAVP